MMADKGKFKYSDCAVLYRMNALSRNIETTLHNMGIPFKVYGGMRFYDRKEIKDILAYLRLINDPKDTEVVLGFVTCIQMLWIRNRHKR